MKTPTLTAKTAYYAKVRAANYADSLRLEGFDVRPKQHRKVPNPSKTGKKQPP